MPRPAPLLLLWLLAACLAALPAWAAPPAAPAPSAAPPQQAFSFRVLDSHDNPQPAARLELEPLAGRPVGGPGFTADRFGVIRLTWLPQGRNALPGSHDQVIRWTSAFHWRISAPDFLPAVGAVNQETTSRVMSDPLLAKLNQKANVVPHGETVVLRRPGEMFAWSAKERPPESPLSKACAGLHQNLARVARKLGAQFAWPAFGLKGDALELYFDWVGAPWGNQAPGPLAGKVALFCGLPLMMAVGQDLPELAGVKRLRLVFHSALTPEDDDYATPVPAQVIMEAPLADVRRLARGESGAREFLIDHPPRLEGGPPPKATPAPKAGQGSPPPGPGAGRPKP